MPRRDQHRHRRHLGHARRMGGTAGPHGRALRPAGHLARRRRPPGAGRGDARPQDRPGPAAPGRPALDAQAGMPARGPGDVGGDLPLPEAEPLILSRRGRRPARRRCRRHAGGRSVDRSARRPGALLGGWRGSRTGGRAEDADRPAADRSALTRMGFSGSSCSYLDFPRRPPVSPGIPFGDRFNRTRQGTTSRMRIGWLPTIELTVHLFGLPVPAEPRGPLVLTPRDGGPAARAADARRQPGASLAGCP